MSVDKIYFNQDFIAKIKEENDIIDLASDYYKLVPFGELFKACCNHGENTPSLIFYPIEQSFFCYGCHAGENGSDVISFIQWMENLNWKDAVIFLADRANIPLPEEDDVNAGLYAAVLNTNRKYYKALKDDPNTMKWFSDKNFDDEDIKTWRLGSSGGKPVYPIIDEQGRTLAFSYRNGEDPKYVNDKTSPIFKKGNVLYGLHVAIKNIRKKKYVVIVEGFNDAIILNKYGVPAIALMSTNLTDYQLNKIKHITKKVIVWLDGDDAGINHTETIALKIANEGINSFIINIDKLDPDEVANTKKQQLEDFIFANAKESYSYLVNKYIGKYNEVIITETKILSESVMPIINSIKNEDFQKTIKDIYLNAISIKGDICTTQQ